MGITIFCQIVLSHSTEKFRRGTLPCLTKFLVSKKKLWIRGGGGGEGGRREYHNFLSKFFCLSAEKFRRNPFVLCFRNFPVAKKFMDKWGGGSIRIFRRKFFVSVPKNSVGEPFSMPLISGIENFYASEGCHEFLSKIFCLTVPKNFVWEPFCAVFRKVFGSE